jgi:hypothetical protein
MARETQQEQDARRATTLIVFNANVPDDYSYACDEHAAEWGEGAAYVGPADIAHVCCFCAAPMAIEP